MYTIWKYPIEDNHFVLELPIGAEFLRAKMQAKKPQMWLLVDPEADKVEVEFFVYATGQTFEDDDLIFLDTFFQFSDGSLVWHVFAKVNYEGMNKLEDVIGLCACKQVAFAPKHKGD